MSATMDVKIEDGKLALTEHEGVDGWDASTPMTAVGQPATRLEGIEKVTGSARYSYDVRLPGQLYAAVLRSPHPHARITRIDTSRAEALPGVHAVISSANTPQIPWFEDSFVFDTTVRYVGDEVAAVAAVSDDVAADALGLIEVEYERLPHVTELEAAIRPDAPKLRDSGNIAGEPTVYDRGDAVAAMAGADVVIDAVFTTQAAIHNSLEPHGCTVAWEGDELTVWASTQSVFTIREDVASGLGIPEHKVRVIKHHMGGGFGAKQVAWKNDIIAPLLAKRAGRPVQLMLDRHAENLASGNRPPTRQHVRFGARSDGTLVAIWADIHIGNGAYQVGGEASNVSGMYQSLYRCDDVHTESRTVLMNTGPAVAFRAPGHVESAWVIEQVMDELARRLDLDPVEIRRRNYSPIDQVEDKPYSLPDGLAYCYDRVTADFGWANPAPPAVAGSKRRGRGFAAHDWAAGSGHPPAYAFAKLNPDGGIDLVTGTQDIGTGTRTGLAQLAAEELGIGVDQVRVQLGDTASGPYSPVSSGSSTMASIGPAVRGAVADVRQQLLRLAAVKMEVAAERLTIVDGRISVIGTTDQSMTIAEVMEDVAPANLLGRGARGPNPSDVSIRTFGAQCVEVEVDTETGEVTVLRVSTAHDIGRIINPALVDSQIHGGITQGIGFALTEERVVDHRLGMVMNANLEEYKIPTMLDVPPISHAHVDVPDSVANITGAKGVGEPPLIPTAPAIANAIFDAVGIRVHDAPISRQRMLTLLAEHGQSAAPEVAR
ncbi:MAG: Xanthine dehydrogenase, molybdenum binding subunit [uncultured Thermomicrobiales bacterium]|uniref:Xanthine dehydrogenase, molybdenum binding subunit n=1 Tax=uncultured Thermomicrobiales bacterium TaxID=1645740 RepID=A0A6J4UVY8_9BACT|nr:MAG: Xanthine dehydrogenase, molybdenum binding subunit [uncultured Thermomicrobiales bacterium]